MSDSSFPDWLSEEHADAEVEELAVMAFLHTLATKVLASEEWDEPKLPRPSDEAQAVSP